MRYVITLTLTIGLGAFTVSCSDEHANAKSPGLKPAHDPTGGTYEGGASPVKSSSCKVATAKWDEFAARYYKPAASACNATSDCVLATFLPNQCNIKKPYNKSMVTEIAQAERNNLQADLKRACGQQVSVADVLCVFRPFDEVNCENKVCMGSLADYINL